MDFTPINTQEEFEAAVTAQYGDVAALQQQVTTLTGERDAHAATIAELQGKVKGFETSALKQKIAKEMGIPVEMADRLNGETEKDLKADAGAVKAMLSALKGPAPMYEPGDGKGKNAELSAMLNELRGE